MTSTANTNKPSHRPGFSRWRSLFKNADALAIVYPLLMVIPNVLLDITESWSVGAKIANLLVPLAIYYLLMCTWSRPGKVVLWMFIFILMNGFQISVLYLFGESIIAVDMLLNILTTDVNEASELLRNLTIPILFSAIVYLPMLAWGAYAAIKRLETTVRLRTAMRFYSWWSLVAGIVLTAVLMLTVKGYSPSEQLYPFNVISNIVTASKRMAASVNYSKTSEAFTYLATDTHTQPDSLRELHVLVIGETSRADNWQLFGYDRPTNPRLSARRDITVFPRAISQSNTTHKCVPLMITHSTPATFDSIMYRKSIFTAFKEAGYRTAAFSNQPKNRSYTQYFFDEADTTLYNSALDRLDMMLVDNLRGVLADTTWRKQFVLLHAYGSHFNYKERYPREYAYFQPDAASDANSKYRPQLLNAYDNSIRYTDAVIDEVIRAAEATGARATVIYVSDHGEDIFDDERGRILHASPVPTYYQLHVPLIVWTSPEYDAAWPEVEPAVKAKADAYVAPSQAVFHTLLSLAGITTPYFDPEQSLVSGSYREPRPVYLSDLNEAVPLEKSGLKESDLQHLRRLRIPIPAN